MWLSTPAGAICRLKWGLLPRARGTSVAHVVKCERHCALPGFLPVVTGDVVNPKGVADVLFPFFLVLAETRQDVNLI